MERCVCAPQYLSAGTFTPPMVSFSLLYCILLHIKLVLFKPTLAQGQLLVAYRQIQQLTQSGQGLLGIVPVPKLTNGFPLAAFLAVVNIYPPIGVGNADGTVAQTVYLVCHSGMPKPNLHLPVKVRQLPTLKKPQQIVGKRKRKRVPTNQQAQTGKAQKLPISSKTAPDIDRKMVKRPTPIKKYPAKLP